MPGSTSIQDSESTLNLKSRISVPCEDLKHFESTANKQDFLNQFSTLYKNRLEKLGINCRKACLKRWKNEKECERIASLASENSESGHIVWIVGTVYMDLPLKECVLDEITREAWVEAPPKREKYVSEQDRVILEDESGRAILSGGHLKEFMLCTGMIIGVLGKTLDDGTFSVLDVCYPLLNPQPSISTEQGESWVAFASGLNIGSDGSIDIKLQMLSDWITGELGNQETLELVSKISRLVIVGNCMAPVVKESQTTVKNRFGREVLQYDPIPLQTLDEFITGIVSGIDVDIVSGPNDPTTHLLPQRPIHTSLLPESSHYSTLHTLTNPHLSVLGGGSVEGESGGGTRAIYTSGQTIDDIFKYLETEDRLEIASGLVGCGLISPTSPDTLWTSPASRDQFIMDHVPHLYVFGNQPQFGTRLLQGPAGTLSRQWRVNDEIEVDQQDNGDEMESCRVVLVPAFSETGTIVLVRMDTLDVKTITFGDNA